MIWGLARPINTASNERDMMTSSNGNIFRVTGPLWWETTGHRWFPLTKARDLELWCFLWSAPERTVEETNRDAGDLSRHRAHYDVAVKEWMCVGVKDENIAAIPGTNISVSYLFFKQLQMTWRFVITFSGSWSQGPCTFKIWEWIYDFNPQFMRDIINCPCYRINVIP